MNVYDNEEFFGKYKQMTRSQLGLEGAGEWHAFRAMMPSFDQQKVLDLGCGYGWHCKYAVEQGAKEIVGIDGSTRMIAEAKVRNNDEKICYQVGDISEMELGCSEYDIVISSLVIHYIKDYSTLVKRIWQTLKPGGYFVFSVEHPIFTANARQEWVLKNNGEIDYWPIKDYFNEKEIVTNFLDFDVSKEHRTLTTYLKGLLQEGFVIEDFVEPMPDSKMLDEMREELHRPMMLLIRARKI